VVFEDRTDIYRARQMVSERLAEAASKPNAQITDIAQILASDMVTSAELLKLVNSALFELPRAVVSVGHAGNLD